MALRVPPTLGWNLVMDRWGIRNRNFGPRIVLPNSPRAWGNTTYSTSVAVGQRLPMHLTISIQPRTLDSGKAFQGSSSRRKM